MRVTYAALICAALMAGGVRAQEPAPSDRPAVTTRLPDSQFTEDDIERLIDGAGPDAMLSVRLQYEADVPLQRIRDVVRRLRLPRVLAFVFRGPMKRPVGMGTYYDEDKSWNYGVCRILIESPLRTYLAQINLPPEQWPVSELVIFGSAYQVRELLFDNSLPPPLVVEAREQPKQLSQRFAEVVKRESDQVIQVPAGYRPPDYCRPFIGLIDAAILSGRTIDPETLDPELSPDEQLRQQLADRSSDTPVTLEFDLNAAFTVEMLAELVERHQLEGFAAWLQPVSNDRVTIEAPFSAFAPPIRQQAQRVRCSMELAADKVPIAHDEWYATRASASLPVAKAWQLLSDPAVVNPRMTGSFEPGDLQRLEIYHQRLARQPLIADEDGPVPPACAPFVQR